MKKILAAFLISLTTINLAIADFKPTGDRRIGALRNKSTSFQGVLVSSAGIGGENTGMSIQTTFGNKLVEAMGADAKVQSELVELLDKNEERNFYGKFITIFSVEMGTRLVFRVEEITKKINFDTPSLPQICGQGMSLVYSSELNICVNTRNTCETSNLLKRGFEHINKCPAGSLTRWPVLN